MIILHGLSWLERFVAQVKNLHLSGENLESSADAFGYIRLLKLSWIWEEDHFNPNVPSWSVIHGNELWDQSGIDSIKFVFKIPTSLGFPHFLYVYAQQGDVLSCFLETCLDRLEAKLPDEFASFKDAEARQAREFLPGNSPSETDLQTS